MSLTPDQLPPPAAPVARPDYQTVALLLQGGGALGAFHAGVYERLEEAGLQPDWVAGISIGAINAAIIAGSPAGERVERLRGFWETVSRTPLSPWLDAVAEQADRGPGAQDARALHGLFTAYNALVFGQPAFYLPRFPPPLLFTGPTEAATSLHDMRPLRATLARFVDFERLNAGKPRVSIGATNVRTGELVYFDTAHEPLTVDHLLASSAMPPGFAAVCIGGEHYWDGGVITNTPLAYVADAPQRGDTLVIQTDIWAAQGPLPTNLFEVRERKKDIQFASRARAIAHHLAESHALRQALARLLERLPEEARAADEMRELRELARAPVCKVVNVAYAGKPWETHSKEYEFSPGAVRHHWLAGLAAARDTLALPGCLDRPPAGQAFAMHQALRPGRP